MPHTLSLHRPVVALLQARMSSSRLPGKVMKPILGRPMLARQIQRVRRAQLLDAIVVVTSTGHEDDPVEALCREEGIPCFRGSLPNVLDRYYHGACHHGAQTIVRLTGDCPLADPEKIDELVLFYAE
ncbi:MAG: NTP transferase domain-containing protein, partial [Desulfobacterales bacterium]|nr:NTP transferase domain-containing protein [Desulfobacterales bacterium]